jgi:hypothetical protein
MLPVILRWARAAQIYITGGVLAIGIRHLSSSRVVYKRAEPGAVKMNPLVCHWDSLTAADNRRQHKDLLEFMKARFPVTSLPIPRYLNMETTVVAYMPQLVKGTLSIRTYVGRDTQNREYRTMKAEFQPRDGVYFSRPQRLAVMLAHHSRLGEGSWLNHLPPDVLCRCILSQPDIIETQDPDEFRAFLERFVESGEMFLDHLFGERDEEFYDEEKSFMFCGDDCGGGLELAEKILGGRIISREHDVRTDKICLTLHAYPEFREDPERRHDILINFEPSERVILVSGLGVVDELRDSDGTFREPGCFAHFLRKLQDRLRRQ